MPHHDREHVSNRTDATAGGTLVHTRELDDFELPSNGPDPRGWDVRSADGSKLGKVEDLLFDTGERRVRYIEVALDRDFARDAGRDYALVPIGQARLNDDSDDVIVDLSGTDLASAPRYDRERLSRDYETSLQSWLRQQRPNVAAGERSGAAADRDIGFYGSPEYDDRRFFSRTRRGQRDAADRARSTGLADRVGDAMDDVKDRIDGNPASRPGPDRENRPL